MRILHCLLVVLLVGCMSEPVVVQTRETELKEPGAAQEKASRRALAEQKRAKKDKNRIICQTTVGTGTHFRKRRCRTVAQMEEEREAARRLLDLPDTRPAMRENSPSQR